MHFGVSKILIHSKPCHGTAFIHIVLASSAAICGRTLNWSLNSLVAQQKEWLIISESAFFKMVDIDYVYLVLIQFLDSEICTISRRLFLFVLMTGASTKVYLRLAPIIYFD